MIAAWHRTRYRVSRPLDPRDTWCVRSLVPVQDDDLFEDDGGVLVPRSGPVAHNAEDYDPRQFAVLLEMQREHFWYRGRHRFVLAALEKHLAGRPAGADGLSA